MTICEFVVVVVIVDVAIVVGVIVVVVVFLFVVVVVKVAVVVVGVFASDGVGALVDRVFVQVDIISITPGVIITLVDADDKIVTGSSMTEKCSAMPMDNTLGSAQTTWLL